MKKTEKFMINFLLNLHSPTPEKTTYFKAR
jgi:hypothetical protein